LWSRKFFQRATPRALTRRKLRYDGRRSAFSRPVGDAR
jgi:hypothetical protein